MSLVDLLHRLRQSPKNNPVLPQQVLTAAVVQVLQENRLLGEILLQLPRKLVPALPGAMGLAWQQDKLVLQVNPQRLAAMRTDTIKNLLEHEALHVVWSHPLRYANHRHPKRVQIATDVAVNQYLPQAPGGTVTLSQLEKLLKRKLPAKLDSQDYLTILEKLTPEEQERLRHNGISLEGDERGAASASGRHFSQDTHHGWQAQSVGDGLANNQLTRLANLSRLLRHAWHETPTRDRGLLPGEIVQKLTTASSPRQANWQQILRRHVGLLARGQRQSHARFNRRQPLRMDLPGRVTQLVAAVNIFVDNSGSVSDEELSAALTTIDEMVKKERMPLNLYSFDAKVTAKTKLQTGKRVSLVRHGGGGTSFQAVFDYLHTHHVSRQGTLNIIITDGWGEKELHNYHYQNICWLLLTSADQLSVRNPPGRVLEMKGESK